MQSERSTLMCVKSDDPSTPDVLPEPHVGASISELSRQSRVMRTMGTPFVADLLAAVDRQLDHAPHTARLIRSRGRTAASSAIAMRINAALHALARQGRVPLLSALYAGEHRRFDEAVAPRWQAMTICWSIGCIRSHRPTRWDARQPFMPR